MNLITGARSYAQTYSLSHTHLTHVDRKLFGSSQLSLVINQWADGASSAIDCRTPFIVFALNTAYQAGVKCAGTLSPSRYI